MVIPGIVNYRKSQSDELPDWIAGFRFSGEAVLLGKRQELDEEIRAIEEKLSSWSNYKKILIHKDAKLRSSVLSVLGDYFGLKVDPDDTNIQDFNILDPSGDIAVVGEVYGSVKGIKLNKVQQVENHRKRLGLSNSTPGLLIVNNQMEVCGIEERLATVMPSDQVEIARSHNITIVRSIDLLLLMSSLESNPNRQKTLMDLLQSGGGWLSVDKSGFELRTD